MKFSFHSCVVAAFLLTKGFQDGLVGEGLVSVSADCAARSLSKIENRKSRLDRNENISSIKFLFSILIALPREKGPVLLGDTIRTSFAVLIS